MTSILVLPSATVLMNGCATREQTGQVLGGVANQHLSIRLRTTLPQLHHAGADRQLLTGQRAVQIRAAMAAFLSGRCNNRRTPVSKTSAPHQVYAACVR